MPTYHIRGTLILGACDPFDSEIEPETLPVDQQIRAESPEMALDMIARTAAPLAQPNLLYWLPAPSIDLIGA
jgi:hypothetical protein